MFRRINPYKLAFLAGALKFSNWIISRWCHFYCFASQQSFLKKEEKSALFLIRGLFHLENVAFSNLPHSYCQIVVDKDFTDAQIFPGEYGL